MAAYRNPNTSAYSLARSKAQSVALRNRQAQTGSVGNRNQSANANAQALAQQQAQRNRQLQAKPKPLAVPGAAAAAVSAPVSPYGAQALPFDAQYDSEVAGANRAYDTTYAGLQYQEGQVRQSYGIDDPSNPFSRAALLQQSYTQQQASRLNQAGNNLYSSAFTAGETQGRNTFDQSNAALRSDYANELQKIQQSRVQAGTDRDTANITAYGNRIARAPAPDDPGNPVAPAGGGGGAAAVKGKLSAAQQKDLARARQREALAQALAAKGAAQAGRKPGSSPAASALAVAQAKAQAERQRQLQAAKKRKR